MIAPLSLPNYSVVHLSLIYYHTNLTKRIGIQKIDCSYKFSVGSLMCHAMTVSIQLFLFSIKFLDYHTKLHFNEFTALFQR